MKPFRILLIAAAVFAVACSENKGSRDLNKDVVILGGQNTTTSTTAGNLMATAIKEANDLEVVLYPSRLVDPNTAAFLPTNDFEIDQLLELYPQGSKDQFRIGTMSGRDLKSFIEDRSRENYAVELDVAGVMYHIHYVAGIQQFSYINHESNRKPLDEERTYRVAISEYFWFSGPTFPSYKYRNGITSKFAEVKFGVSARESLRKYLKSNPELPYLKERRANVTRHNFEDIGFKKINFIQDQRHQTSHYGKIVTTRGIVTAMGTVQWYPGGVDLYIQDPEADDNDATSEAVAVHFDGEDLQKFLPNTEGELDYEPLRMGDLIEIKGVIYDQILSEGLGKTVIREIQSVKRISRDNPLPEAIEIGEGTSRPIPQKYISTYRGDLNLKPYLNLEDGIDFWRSLQGMRVRMKTPRIVGFRGGVESFADDSPKGYLTLYVVADGNSPMACTTLAGGCIIDDANEIFNPHIIPIVSNHLSRPLNTGIYFKVNDTIAGAVEGIVGYETNIFGGGEYSLVIPRVPSKLKSQQAQSSFTCDLPSGKKADSKITDDFDCFMAKFSDEKDQPRKRTFELKDRGVTKLTSDDDSLTVATFNIQNLSNEKNRVLKLAESIQVNLKCPDILNLVEVQDDNGPDLSGSSSAMGTLQAIVDEIKCPNVRYEILNVDPSLHGEGGQPGGNIRVAMLYNSNKVGFSRRGNPKPFDEAVVLSSGDLNFNPARIRSNDPAFKGSRRSLVAQFTYKGEKIFVIGNHFNSKLGDKSLWGNQQPPIFRSESRRALIADRVGSFVNEIVRRDPNAHIVVLGDFNAYINEPAMKALAGEHLQNLVSYGNLIPQNERYSITYNGNSQPLDYIFVNNSLLQKNPQIEIIHMNTDFMGRIADHDPVVSKFYFR